MLGKLIVNPSAEGFRKDSWRGDIMWMSVGGIILFISVCVQVIGIKSENAVFSIVNYLKREQFRISEAFFFFFLKIFF